MSISWSLNEIFVEEVWNDHIPWQKCCVFTFIPIDHRLDIVNFDGNLLSVIPKYTVKRVWPWLAIRTLIFDLEVPQGSCNYSFNTTTVWGACPQWCALLCTRVTWISYLPSAKSMYACAHVHIVHTHACNDIQMAESVCFKLYVHVHCTCIVVHVYMYIYNESNPTPMYII